MHLILPWIKPVVAIIVANIGVDAFILTSNLVPIGCAEQKIPSSLLRDVVWVVEDITGSVGHGESIATKSC